ncbi:VOC family protein [Arthrobacter agilis]|jgi:predicted lactoylglutathione lyase|uniref:VOC family protein n=1 Tax=Arthrobacter agilis TaxID=37921 RepID=UPI00278A6E80|nr:VOC family protein [Arthrobacter agilis]MDQ0735698.1 putative lactoylglutathione lyase [Arthrobacter agilis]
MATNVFINLPVSDLARSKEFYTSFGWTLDPNFSNDDAGAVAISDTIFLMILTHQHWAQFTDKPVADAHSTSAVINAISVDAPEEIDTLVEQAVAAGATENKSQELGFMRSRSFSDPDGHAWEVMWMDPIAQSGDWQAVQAKYGDQQPV